MLYLVKTLQGVVILLADSKYTDTKFQVLLTACNVQHTHGHVACTTYQCLEAMDVPFPSGHVLLS